MRTLSLVAVAGLLVLTARPAAADAIDDYVRAQMAARHIPGVAVAVVQQGRVTRRSVYGQASLEFGVPVRPDTLFSLASTTKIFTALAIMTLVQEGRINLDQPVRGILTDLPEAWSPVTFRQCLSHTSGLPDAVTDDLNVIHIAADRDTLLRTLADRPVNPAGVRSAYNQTCYILMGMAIERLGGRSYADYVRDRILVPARMTGARFGDAWEVMPGRSELYTAVDVTADHRQLLRRDGRPAVSDRVRRFGSKVFPDFSWPTVGLNASLNDLVAFELALRTGRIVPAPLLAEMIRPQRLSDGRDGDWGLGFVTSQANGRRVVSYGGGAAVWRVSLPEDDLTVIVLTNLQGSSPQVLAGEIARIVAGRLNAPVAASSRPG